jgi:hypothetical protein
MLAAAREPVDKHAPAWRQVRCRHGRKANHVLIEDGVLVDGPWPSLTQKAGLGTDRHDPSWSVLVPCESRDA